MTRDVSTALDMTKSGGEIAKLRAIVSPSTEENTSTQRDTPVSAEDSGRYNQ